jgi:hypothetical protein
MSKKVCSDPSHGRIHGENNCRVCDASVARKKSIKATDEEE